MYVHTVSIQNFRNIHHASVQLCSGINILYGDNAQGKTNFLESIYVCATGRSQRTYSDQELISFSSELSHIRLHIQDDTQDRIELILRKTAKKSIAINGIPIKKLSELFGILLTVIFSPEDLQLIKAGPSERRRFVDLELCQLSKVYCHALQQYYRILKQRNILLKKIKHNQDTADTLSIWDEQLVYYGEQIIHQRAQFIETINPIAEKIHRRITKGKEVMHILYKSHVHPKHFEERLKKNRARDILQGSTSVGVHKDDIAFFMNNIDGRRYGSQGQQRTAALSTKLAEIDLIRQQKNKTPVLLLDDVMSELDTHRQYDLLESVQDLQVILTCTGMEELLQHVHIGANIDNKVYQVHQGTVLERESFAP